MFLASSIKPARKEAPWGSQCPTQPCWLTVTPSHRPAATLKVRRTLCIYPEFIVPCASPSFIYSSAMLKHTQLVMLRHAKERERERKTSHGLYSNYVCVINNTMMRLDCMSKTFLSPNNLGKNPLFWFFSWDHNQRPGLQEGSRIMAWSSHCEWSLTLW